MPALILLAIVFMLQSSRRSAALQPFTVDYVPADEPLWS